MIKIIALDCWQHEVIFCLVSNKCAHPYARILSSAQNSLRRDIESAISKRIYAKRNFQNSISKMSNDICKMSSGELHLLIAIWKIQSPRSNSSRFSLQKTINNLKKMQSTTLMHLAYSVSKM